MDFLADHADQQAVSTLRQRLAPPSARSGAAMQGDALHGFERVDQQAIEEYSANASLYRHAATGAHAWSGLLLVWCPTPGQHLLHAAPCHLEPCARLRNERAAPAMCAQAPSCFQSRRPTRTRRAAPRTPVPCTWLALCCYGLGCALCMALPPQG